MTRNISKRKRHEKKLKEKGYIECGYCGKLVKPNALRCEHCSRWYSSGKQAIAIAITLAVVFSITGTYYFYPLGGQGAYVPPSNIPTVLNASPVGLAVSPAAVITVSFNKPMNTSSVESAFSISPPTQGTFSWSENTLRFSPTNPLSEGATYTVTIGAGAKDLDGKSLDCGAYTWRFTTAGGTTNTLRSIGTGDNDFWSAQTTHPSWVSTAVQTRPLLILTHTTGCYPCTIMTGVCDEISKKYAGRISYYDLTSGVDEPSASQTFQAYDLAPPNYVPLTTLVTLGPGNQIIWHSWEGVLDETTLSSWIDDAISYHNM